ncbi:MAG: M18 family aminopeptidase, partial [Oscillospiraceae bacterium]|nr:M18 family aminopeptidase [Oscillospiraceae bacterium]
MSQGIQEYLRWLDAGISPYHCVEKAAAMLDQAGFAALDLAAAFHLQPGGKYYVKNGSFLAAFAIGAAPDHFRIAAAHTDWPCLKLKPDPEQVTGGCCKLSVEPYGGAILNTWMDRPLSLAGTVLLK